jgi:Domain of Unknown Function (DUF928)
MFVINSCNFFKFLTLISLMPLLITGLSTRAESGLVSTYLPKRTIQAKFKPPKTSKPKDSSGAGSRDGLGCPGEQPIQVLMPHGNYGLTYQERPPIYIKMAGKTKAQRVVLAFQDEALKSYQRVFVPINSSGIISFSLPSDKKALIPGQNYQWSLAVVCGNTLQPDDPVFRGWVQRVARTPEVERQRLQKSTIEQITWLADKGFWYDMLDIMIKARLERPKDAQLATMWKNILQDSGLDAVISEPNK